MALRDIKRQIVAVGKTKQITRAMNMVAASKLKDAQMRMENFRPYAIKFMDVLSSLALRVDTRAHALLAVRDPRRIRVILMTSDRGLCGGFNTNLIKMAEQFMAAKVKEGKEVSLIPVGRKARDYFRRKSEDRPCPRRRLEEVRHEPLHRYRGGCDSGLRRPRSTTSCT